MAVVAPDRIRRLRYSFRAIYDLTPLSLLAAYLGVLSEIDQLQLAVLT
jgi:hypothetical protein